MALEEERRENYVVDLMSAPLIVRITGQGIGRGG